MEPTLCIPGMRALVGVMIARGMMNMTNLRRIRRGGAVRGIRFYPSLQAIFRAGVGILRMKFCEAMILNKGWR